MLELYNNKTVAISGMRQGVPYNNKVYWNITYCSFSLPFGHNSELFKSSGITVSTFSRLWTSLSSFRKSYHWSLMYTAWRGFFQLQFPYNKYCKCKIYHQKILPRSWWRLKRFLPRSQRPTKFSGHESCESENTNFSKCHLI